MKTIFYSKEIYRILFIVVLSLFVIAACQTKRPIKVLVVTGGHAYDTANFVKMFRQMESVSFDTLIQPSANMLYNSPEIEQYDALVFYDMHQQITEDQKTSFINLLEQGKGVVFLHHSIGSYQEWDEYIQILGGRYDLDSSGYQEGIDIEVEVLNPKNPVTKGLADFSVHDESYYDTKVIPGIKPILRTSHEKSDEYLGWTNQYGNSRIVYLQSGHDNNAYSNLNYRQLIEQAIAWVSR
jgi:type 1 glutamine amidotransferase